MHGLNQSTSMRGRAVSWGSATLLTLCLIGAPISVHAQSSADAEPSFSVQSGAIIDKAFDLAADDDMPGAIALLDELALNTDLTPFERSSVSQMIGAYNYELGQLFEAKVAFDAAVEAGGLSQKEIDGMKPVLANINALDKLGLLKPKPATPKAEPIPEPKKTVIVKTDPVLDVEDPALLMASVETRPDAPANQSPVLETEPVIIPSDDPIVIVMDMDAPDAQVVKEAALKTTDDDRDAQPLKRVPPEMPRRFLEGDHSGYCDVRFDVSPEGQPFDVDTTRCTNSELKRSTVKSVEKWTFSPKIVNGRAVSRSGVEAKVRYVLTDKRGRKLPLPSGY